MSSRRSSANCEIKRCNFSAAPHMTPRILLINPPIHDFSAYDFWLKPYGLLHAAGFLRGQAELRLFDYLDRGRMQAKLRADAWGRGEFLSQPIARPEIFSQIPRRYHR